MKPPPETASKRTHPLKLTATGLLSAAGFVAVIGTICGFGGRFWWFLDLASHFRVQYLLSLTIVAPALLALRAYRPAIVFTAAALLNLAFIAPLYLGPSTSPEPGVRSYRAMLINVYTGNTDHAAVLDCIREHDPDFLVLEEVNARWMRQILSLHERYPYSITRPREDNFGIALFSKHLMAGSEAMEIGDAGVPSLLARFEMDGDRFYILGTHALPPVNSRYAHTRDRHLSEIPEIVADLDAPVLLLGDLNASPWSYNFRKLVRESGLRDSMRGRGIQPTWPAKRLPMRIPIDHALHSGEIGILHRRTGAPIGSDHLPVIVDFAVR